jgi:hypothetical protein
MEEQTPVQKKVPVLIRAVAVILFLQSLLALGIATYATFFLGIQDIPTGARIVLILIMLAVLAISFVICRALYKGRNWSRVLNIVFGCVGVVFGLKSMILDGAASPWNIAMFAINVAITAYLWFNRDVRAAFIR